MRVLREYLDLTQEQFAERAGLSYKFYQQIESGRKKQVWLETIDRIASGFGLQSWQLLAPDPPASLKPAPGYPTARDIAAKWLVAEKSAAATPVRRPRKKKK